MSPGPSASRWMLPVLLLAAGLLALVDLTAAQLPPVRKAGAGLVLPRPEAPFTDIIARTARGSVKDFPAEVKAPGMRLTSCSS